jgi:hypothetical protein
VGVGQGCCQQRFEKNKGLMARIARGWVYMAFGRTRILTAYQSWWAAQGEAWNVMVIESYFDFLIIGRGINRGIRILVCLITSRALSEPTVSPVRGQEFAADRLVSSIDILETK